MLQTSGGTRVCGPRGPERDGGAERAPKPERCAVLFTDIQTPGALDGMDLVREVHARWPRVLLVIASGRRKPSQAEIPDDGRFLSKPYGAEELFREVDDLMRKRRGSN